MAKIATPSESRYTDNHMTGDQIAEHNRIFQEATEILKGRIRLDEHAGTRTVTERDWGDLERAIQLLQRVLELNPENWASMWFIGKIYQRFDNHSAAYDWFKRSYAINPSQPDVAREASISAAEIGEADAAIKFAYRAIQIAPGNSGLYANLAVANLQAGRLEEADVAVRQALAGNPTDDLSKTVAAMIKHFRDTGITPPVSTTALLNYWRRIGQKSR
jgi:tetratricopeptide (TPR) repeat protein